MSKNLRLLSRGLGIRSNNVIILGLELLVSSYEVIIRLILRSFYKEVAGKTRVPVEGILNVWFGYLANR